VIDPQPLTDFEQQYATVLDVFDALKKIQPPVGADVPPDVARWAKELHEALLTLPSLPNPDSLTRFGEDVDENLVRIENKADMAQVVDEPDDDELLPEPMPAATAQYQVLTANQADLTDIRFDWVRAH